MRFAAGLRHRRASVAEPARFVTACALSATPQVGVAVGVTLGAAYGSGTISYAYQWKLDGSNIGSATSSTYTPLAGDAAHTLSCAVAPTGTGGSAGSSVTAGISVAAAAGGGTGTATFGWDTPALDGDGAALSDLANYRVYAGYAPGIYTLDSGLLPSSQASTVLTNDHSYTFNGLTNGQTVYITVVAVDSGGNESHFSTEMSKAIA